MFDLSDAFICYGCWNPAFFCHHIHSLGAEGLPLFVSLNLPTMRQILLHSHASFDCSYSLSPVPFTPPLRSDCVSVKHSSMMSSKKENCSSLSKADWDMYGLKLPTQIWWLYTVLCFTSLFGEWRGNSPCCVSVSAFHLLAIFFSFEVAGGLWEASCHNCQWTILDVSPLPPCWRASQTQDIAAAIWLRWHNFWPDYPQ